MAVVVTNPQLVHAILLISKPVDTFAWFFYHFSHELKNCFKTWCSRRLAYCKPETLWIPAPVGGWKPPRCLRVRQKSILHEMSWYTWLSWWYRGMSFSSPEHCGLPWWMANCPSCLPCQLIGSRPACPSLSVHARWLGPFSTSTCRWRFGILNSTLVAPGSSGSTSVCPASLRLLPQSSHLSSEQWPGEGEPTWFDFVFALKRCHRNRSLWPIWGFPIGRESKTLRSSIAFGRPRWVGRLVILPQFHNDITEASDLKQWRQGPSRLGGHLVIPSRTGVVGLWQAWWRQDTACGGCQVDVDYNYLPVLLLHTVSARSSHSPPLALNCSCLLRTMQCGVGAGVIVQGGPALQQHLHHTTNRNSFLLSPRFSTKSDNCKLC